MKEEELQKTILENKSNIALIKQAIEYIGKDISNLREEIKNLSLQLANGYAKKEETSDLEKRIDRIESWQGWFVKIVGGAIIVAVLAAIGLEVR